MKKSFTAVLFSLLLLNVITFAQSKKAYILSEGGFSSGSSKLSMYSISQNQFIQNIFTPGNLGLYPDGLLFYDNFLYLLEQGNYGGAGKIYRLDTNGAVQSSFSFGTNPYSLAAANSKIYATNGPTGKVSVLNINSFNVIKEITVGVYPQEILAVNNLVFVCNTSMYGGQKDSTVSVINATNDSVIAVITVHKDPSSLAVSKDGKLLIGCPGSGGKIFKVDMNTFQKTDSIAVSSGFDKDISVDRNTGNIYFINYSNGISYCDFSNHQTVNVITNPNPATMYFYGYNYDYTNNKHLIADAKDFIVNGSLYVYNASGTMENSFTTGIAPRRIIFNVQQSVPVNEISEIVKGFELYQNFPNPFNPSTSIRFSLLKQNNIELTVYDAAGKEVSVLLNGTRKAGTYEYKFDAGKLSSGIYFYKLSTESQSVVKKMMLIK